MTTQENPWCPYCFDYDCQFNDHTFDKNRVYKIEALDGPKGKTLNPWENGGWACDACGLRAPRIQWANLMKRIAEVNGYERGEFYPDVRKALFE